MTYEPREKALFENSPVLHAVIRLAFPTVIGQIILVIYNIADTFFIGLTGSDALMTAVTVCMPAFLFLSAISNLFGVGGSSVISRALGCKNAERAGRASAFSFWGCLAVTLAYILATALCMDSFIRFLGGSAAEVLPHARWYLTITVVMGGAFTTTSALLSHLLRSEGRSIHASAGIALGGLLNIALDPLFMFVILPRGHEIQGAALATALSNVASLIYFAAALRAKSHASVLRLGFTRRMFNDGIPADIMACGLPACLMTMFENISYAVLDNLMSLNGIAMQAGLGVAKKVNMLAHCIARGMAHGVLPLISYNYASENYKRMQRVIMLSICMSIALATLCMTVNLIFSDDLVGLFISGGTDSADYGARFLRILCIGCPFSACAYAIISFFQAVGRGLKSFALAILRKGILDIPLMLILSRPFPVRGIVWATPIADILCWISAMALFTSFMRLCGPSFHGEMLPAYDADKEFSYD